MCARVRAGTHACGYVFVFVCACARARLLLALCVCASRGGRRVCTPLAGMPCVQSSHEGAAGASVMRASREGAVRARVSGCVCTNVRALIAIEVY